MKREYIMEIECQFPLGSKELVRCKNCKYYGKTMGSCAKLDGYDYPPDFYCACGERKDGDGE